ncbi:hypothetical protein FACS189431_3610 [Alphaproteobacteria bacterium]|nr:hypothetical protein FACS189431_3610 [Alphaproteobacteria bacterium]
MEPKLSDHEKHTLTPEQIKERYNHNSNREGIMKNSELSIDGVESKIITLDNQQVILDSDIAQLYDVDTKRVNEAIKNNPEKFPDGYVISLTNDEWQYLKSKISTSSWGGKNKPAKVFTEKGVYMLATILKGEKAVKTTLAIIDTFAKVCELGRTVNAVAETDDVNEKSKIMEKTGGIIVDLITENLPVAESELTVELNLAVLKLKKSTKYAKK